jgi:hypothetical protein
VGSQPLTAWASFWFTHKNSCNKFLFPLIRATCPAHLILVDLVILIIFDEKYTLNR